MPTEFVVDGSDGGVRAGELARALRAEAAPAYTGRTTWFDTFDWRLFGAGLLLELHTRDDDRRLVLSDLDGRRLSAAPFAAAEVTVAALPDGVIRAEVARRAGIRALLPRAVAEGPVTVLSVLDELDKTVARIAVEGPLTTGDGTTLDRRVRIEPLRGYAKEARRVGGRLRHVAGLTATDEPLHQAAFRAAGLVAGGYRSKPTVSLEPDRPAAHAFAAVLGQQLAVVRACVDGTLDQLDTEFLHDLRVAVRRSRSLLKPAAGVLPDDLRAHYDAELRWLSDATSESRDLDVYLLGFDAMAGQVADTATMEPFRALLERHHRRAHTRLNRALRSARFHRLLARWDRDVGTLGSAGQALDPPIADVADARLAKAWRRVEKRGAVIDAESPAERLHDLRKRCKELRYLLEFFGSLYDQGAHQEMVGELKQLQDNLGEFQDAEAQGELVLRYAEELAATGAPAATLVAMGRLEEHLRQRQATARAQFAERWSRFDRPHNRRLATGLVAAR